MALMEVEFGTKEYGKVLFEVDDYDIAITVGSSNGEKIRAYNILRVTMNDPTFIGDGHRNDDAVNSCIALHVLGFDPIAWFKNFFDDSSIESLFYHCDIVEFMDHVNRICGAAAPYQNYLYRWGPAGDEGAALGYVID